MNITLISVGNGGYNIASDLTVIQDNESLNQIEELGLNGLDKPIVDTMLSALKNRTLPELMEIRDKELRDSVIPSIYRLDGNALIEKIRTFGAIMGLAALAVRWFQPLTHAPFLLTLQS